MRPPAGLTHIPQLPGEIEQSHFVFDVLFFVRYFDTPLEIVKFYSECQIKFKLSQCRRAGPISDK
jgi:hypothetical protein